MPFTQIITVLQKNSLDNFWKKSESSLNETGTGLICREDMNQARTILAKFYNGENVGDDLEDSLL